MARSPAQRFATLLDGLAERVGAALDAARVDLLGRMAAIVRMDPFIQEPGRQGIGRFELQHISRLQRMAEIALDEWAAAALTAALEALPTVARLGREDADRALATGLRGAPALREALSAEDERLFRLLGLTPAAAAGNPAAQGLAQAFLPELIQGLTQEAKVAAGRIIRFGVLSGTPPLEIMRQMTRLLVGEGAEEIGALIGRVTPTVSFRAEVIVRTETARLLNASIEARQAEFTERVPGLRQRWISARDGRVRRGHQEIDAETARDPIPVGEPFPVRVYSAKGVLLRTELLMYPLDPSGSPEATIQCRCRAVTVATREAIEAIGAAR